MEPIPSSAEGMGTNLMPLEGAGLAQSVTSGGERESEVVSPRSEQGGFAAEGQQQQLEQARGHGDVAHAQERQAF